MKYILKPIFWLIKKIMFWTIITVLFVIANGARLVWEFKLDTGFFQIAEDVSYAISSFRDHEIL